MCHPSYVWQLLASFFVIFSILRYVRADVTLFVPGFNEEPLSAGVLGVDEFASRTTWAILPGTQTGVVPAPSFTDAATLIEGPSDARMLFGTFDISCTITTGFAFCTGDRGFPITPQELGTATAFVLQGGGPLTSSLPNPTATAAGATLTDAAPAPADTAVSPAATNTDAAPGIAAGGAALPTITAPASIATVIPALATASALSTLRNPAASGGMRLAAADSWLAAAMAAIASVSGTLYVYA